MSNWYDTEEDPKVSSIYKHVLWAVLGTMLIINIGRPDYWLDVFVGFVAFLFILVVTSGLSE